MSKARKLTLTRETIETLQQCDIAGIHGGTSPLTTISLIGESVATVGLASAAACGLSGIVLTGQAATGFTLEVRTVRAIRGAVNGVKRAIVAVSKVGAEATRISHVCR